MHFIFWTVNYIQTLQHVFMHVQKMCHFYIKFAVFRKMDDEVVISGVGGHFPECDNLQEFRDKLLKNLHLISNPAGELQPSKC